MSSMQILPVSEVLRGTVEVEGRCATECAESSERRRKLEARFWATVNKDGPIPLHVPEIGPCWEWTGRPGVSGYGRLWTGSERWTAHRFSYALNVSPIPDGLWVLHKCDNRKCVRPDHLFLGTVLENNRDAIRKGRRTQAQNIAPIYKAELHGAAKLTWAKVEEMRRLHVVEGASFTKLGMLFGVSDSTALRAVKGINWKPSTAHQEART